VANISIDLGSNDFLEEKDYEVSGIKYARGS
jgi:hypothetical protein